MEDVFIKIGICVSLAFNIKMWWDGRNKVTSKRNGEEVELWDRYGIIKDKIISEK